MVSWAEIGIVIVAGGYLIGRKELPRMAKMGGRYVGRTVGAVLRAKNEYFEATKNSDLVKMQSELQKGLDELNQIRSEMTTISSMKRPYRPVSTPANRPPATASPLVAASDAAAALSSTYTPPASSHSSISSPSSIQAATISQDYLAHQSFEDLIQSAEDQEQARLAMAEINMAHEQKFASRIESVEGGADYVASSLMDSILLQRRV
ncbi:hypothetical protein DYB37_003600 [Aphanomyces astaci]|uniref:Uncharacterized protein n=1 Tax=Aphanomyces astaci TaxID=112090 RepID=A0A397A213_APHAT|nr:hypothetical protein DYB36_000159 [Aphanomyces astaci]RHY37542.1 hypothetical protein DYB25_005154 [Aphanomyces astaci]RHY39517.1 hypothetical protein DYB30_011706 [Aphanomyces astaci]RHY44106.1 hypothetical protein DYB38_000560 [Aphanomyces astaci]RHY58789.1 hypothetical protein DYB34_005950 [Aphanomyces astaci]